MKRMLLLGMGVAALAFAGCAGSKEEKRGEQTAAKQAESSKEGTIVSVQEDTITVRDAENPQGRTIRFQRTAETDIVRDDRPFSWTQLSQGMPVRVSYAPVAGEERATRVEVLTGSEAEQVRSRAGESGGWERPEGITRPRGQGGPPPADMPHGGATGREGAPPPNDAATDSMDTNE